MTQEQKSSLKKGYQNGKSHIFRRKCQCILLSHEGKTVSELCEFFSVSRISIYTWLKEWESQGIAGLQLKPGRGRPTKLKDTDEEQIKTLVENEPRNLNRVVGQIKSEMDIDLSKKTLQRFLKNLNLYGNASVEE